MSPSRPAVVGPATSGSHRPPTLLVIEKNAFVREGLTCLLESAGYPVAWKTTDPDQGVSLCRQFTEAILLLAGLPTDRHRVDVIRGLHDAGLRPSVVAIIDRSEDVEIPELIALGVGGIVDRDDDPPKLFEAITATHTECEVWLSPRVAVKLIPARQNGSGHPELTLREQEMLWRVAHGQANELIGDEMFIAPGTVRNHLSNIYSKLGVHSRAEAVAWAWRTGLAQTNRRTAQPVLLV